MSAPDRVHKLTELDDVVVDRADEESDALIHPAGCSLVERFNNLGLDRQFQLGVIPNLSRRMRRRSTPRRRRAGKQPCGLACRT